MAKTIFAPGIESVSGALTKINLRSSHVLDQNMLLATHRKSETCSLACQRTYFRKANQLPWQNTDFVSPEVLAQRLAFKTNAAAIISRKENMTYLTGDQAAFVALKEELKNSNVRITLKSFYWAALKKYSGTFPNQAIEMTAQEYRANTSAGNAKY